MRAHALLSLAGLAALLPAQVSGTLLVDPAGGPGAFRTITSAMNSLFVSGINGSVEVLIAPGAYTETVLILPIAGASNTGPTVTLRSRDGSGTVVLQGNTSDVFGMVATNSVPVTGIVYDGLDFAGGPRYAISGGQRVEGVVIRNCTFAPGFAGPPVMPGVAYGGSISWSTSQPGWIVQRCHFVAAPSGARYAQTCIEGRIVPCEVHHNVFDLDQVGVCIDLGHGGRVYDNLFRGSLVNSSNLINGVPRVVWVGADSNQSADVVCNTFSIRASGTGCCIAIGGFGFPGPTRTIRGNLFAMTGGSCLTAVYYQSNAPFAWTSDNNLFWSLGGEIGNVGSFNPLVATRCSTLAAWRTLTGKDAASIAADPQFVSIPAATPRAGLDQTRIDLHPGLNSPVRNAAGPLPAYVLTDFDGRSRPRPRARTQPDIGAYECSNIAIFDDGNPGTGGLVPTMAGIGTAAIGSTTFAVDLSNARPNTLAVLLGGLSRTIWNTLPLPVDLGGGCNLLVSPDAILSAVTAAAGTATMPLPIPLNNALRGLEVHFQWLVADPVARGGHGVAASNGGTLAL